MSNVRTKQDYTGTVSWFDDKLGYGFLECPDFQKGIFVHYSRIMTGEQYRTLSKGQIVRFEVAKNVHGLQAVNVREDKIPKLAMTTVTTETNNQQ